MTLPYSSHPLYHIRKPSVLIAILGVLLTLFSLPPYISDSSFLTIIFLVFSAGLCVVDLHVYALKKVEKPDEDPAWPEKKWIAIDAVMAVMLQFVFWIGLTTVGYGYYPDLSVTFHLYGVLAAMLCSILHAYSLRKELAAHYKAKWLASLPPTACPRCGYGVEPADVLPVVSHRRACPRPATPPPNVFAYVGPDASAAPLDHPQYHRRADTILTPFSPIDADSSMGEGLLIGSDFGTGYGAIEPTSTFSPSRPPPRDTDEPRLDQPDELMVSSRGSGKGKGKKKRVDRG